MPSTMTQTCALCGLRYINSALLELHIREDHVQQNQQAAAAPEDAAGSWAPQPGAGRPGSTAMAPQPPGSLPTVTTAGTAATRPRRRLPGALMAALRRPARVARPAVQAVRYANQELLRASEAISLRRAPEPRRPLQNSTDNNARPASGSPEPIRRAA